jgi:hypothetical protein
LVGHLVLYTRRAVSGDRDLTTWVLPYHSSWKNVR